VDSRKAARNILDILSARLFMTVVENNFSLLTTTEYETFTHFQVLFAPLYFFYQLLNKSNVDCRESKQKRVKK